MNYKHEYPYNYGYLSSSVKGTIREIELLLTQMRGDNKQTLQNILKGLKTDLETTEKNTNSTCNGQQQ